jgi:hypothetical protein
MTNDDAGNPPPGDSGSGGGDSTMSVPDTGSTCSPTLPDGAACNSLEPSGPLVPYECLSATPPTPGGGTIVDGTYVLTSTAYYGTTCPAPEQDRDTWLVCGTNWQTAQEHTMGTMAPTSLSFDANVGPGEGGPASLALQFTCGTSGIETIEFEYTATPTTLTLFPSAGRVDVFTRQ